MAQTSYAYAQQTRDPMTAAMLSMVPGLGQFYNGESRKGILFFDVALINFGLMSLIILAPTIVNAMNSLGHQYGMKMNHGVMQALMQLHIGSPVSIVVLGMVISFVAYAVRDAYDHAMLKRRRALYSDSIIELNEATSGAYIVHASIIVALAVMALFFFIPKPLARQITEIEFFTTVEKTVKPKVESKIQSMTNNEAKSKTFDKAQPVNKMPPKTELAKTTPVEKPTHAIEKTASASEKAASAAAAHSASSSASAAQPQIKPIQPHEAPAGAAKPMLIASAIHQPTMVAMPHQPTAIAAPALLPSLQKAIMPASSAAPTLQPKTMSSGGAMVPMPMTQAPGLAAAVPMTLPSQMPAGSLPHAGSSLGMPTLAAPSGGVRNGIQLPGISNALPSGGASSSRTVGPIGPSTGPAGSSNVGAPGPLSIPTHTPGTGTGPQPEVITPGNGRNGAGKHKGPDGTGDSDVPLPKKAGRNYVGDGIRIIPSIGAPAAPGNQSSSSDKPLNVGREGVPSGESAHSPDFTKYMEEIQRRIKRSWFPPKDMQKRRVKVMFKVHTNGEMSNLRVCESSGYTTADQAALQAVKDSSPFHQLPQYSPENVDIEFTFDYNVFSSR